MPDPHYVSHPLRIGIVEDQMLVLELLGDLCESRLGWAVVLSETTGAGTRALVSERRPNAMLIDINLPDEDGIVLGMSLRALHSGLKVVILSAECTEYTIHRVRESGLDGFVDKNARPEVLQQALESVFLSGRTYYSPVVRATAQRMSNDANCFNKILSARECELLALIGIGYSDTQVSALMCIGDETARKHRHNIMGKIGVHNQAELVRFCLAKGFVQARPDGTLRAAKPPASSR